MLDLPENILFSRLALKAKSESEALVSGDVWDCAKLSSTT